VVAAVASARYPFHFFTTVIISANWFIVESITNVIGEILALGGRREEFIE
jgi:hypothetical protein